MNYKKLITLILLFNINLSSFADMIIRDSEIEATMQAITDPIAKAANLKNVKIYIINDDSLNAFTYGGHEIFIYSGLIKKFPDIDVIRGVIAHEIGHIYGQHVSRQSQNADSYGKVVLSSIAAAIGLMSLAKGDLNVALIPAFGATHFAERSMLTHSRTFESSADQTAFRLLEKTGHSVGGMIQFFEYMNKEHRVLTNINPYDLTHPLSSERLSRIKSFYQRSKYQVSGNSTDLLFNFQRCIAKLLAFTTELKRLDQFENISDNEEANNYFKAIKYYRKSELNKAIKYIDLLLKIRPNDPFYNELKGQILFDFGKKESLPYYNKAVKLRPTDILLKLERAVIGINIFANEPNKMQEYYHDLKEVLLQEPDNLSALFYLSIYYSRINRPGESLLYTAIIAAKTGDLLKAKNLAKSALKLLKIHSTGWYKAHDIILTEK